MTYLCRRCSYSQESCWEGHCPGCGGLYRAISSGVEGSGRSTFARASEVTIVRIPTGVEGFDKTMGGGLVAGTAILFVGQHGAGKSTLAAMLEGSFAEKYQLPCLYASAEESVEGVLTIAKRVGCMTELVEVIHEGYLPKVIAHAKRMKAAIVVFDSFNRYAPGPTAEKAGVHLLTKYVRETKAVAIAINQMAKDGTAKGTTEGSHGFDVEVFLGAARLDDVNAPFPSKSCDPFGVRVLYTNKNRRASLVTTYWEMSQEGVMTCVEERLQKPTRGRKRS